ncbi:hypothetical protein Tco_0018941 [Tanacetum coccineum]
MAFVPKHNQVGFLKKPEGSAGFEQIVDFLKGTHIRYALEHNPTIYVLVIKQFWQTVTVIRLDNGEQELKATIDTHEYTIFESSVRNKLKLADENGITEFTNAKTFEGMANLGSKSGGWDEFGSKLATALICLSTGRTYNFSKMIFEAMVANIFGNMNKGFVGVNRPLLANMIAGHDENQGEPQEEPVESQPPPNASVPSTSQPTTKPHPDQELETKTELHGSSSDFVHTPPTQVETSSPELKSISPEPMEHTYDQPQPSPIQQPASPEPQPTSPPKSPPLQGPTSTYDEAIRINVADLLHLKVKKLETRVKYGNLPTRKMVLSDSESKDAANSSKQGRNLGEEDVFETPKGKDSGEADISLSGLQAAETLVQVTSQKTKTYTRRVKSGLKKKLDVGVSSGDRKLKSASEEIKSGFTNISSGEVRVSQRKGKEVLEEQPQPKRSKKQIREEEASLAEIARIQAQEAAEIERKAELQRLDALAAKRLNDEFEMSEQQRKRAAEVQQQAQYYTEEDWDLIRARMEASTELRKSVFGSDIDAEDYAKKMVELVEKRRREIREQKLKAKKNKPMTQAEQRNYMMNYVRSQSHGWTIPQLKKLSFEELKVQFERTIRSIENFIPMDSEKEKESLKRSGETLQGAEKKKQKVLDVEDIPIPESAKFVKEEEIEVKQPVLKMSRRKSKARKGIGLHTSTEPESGEVDITSSKIVKWKILRHGGKGYCHLIRANQRDSVFVNFGAMLHNISRDDLVDLYKIVLLKTTAYSPKEDSESAFAENLRIMFDPPQSEDILWSLPMHIPIVNWRYYDSCNVHCLNLHNITTLHVGGKSISLSEEVTECEMSFQYHDMTYLVAKGNLTTPELLQRSNSDDTSVPVSNHALATKNKVDEMLSSVIAYLNVRIVIEPIALSPASVADSDPEEDSEAATLGLVSGLWTERLRRCVLRPTPPYHSGHIVPLLRLSIRPIGTYAFFHSEEDGRENFLPYTTTTISSTSHYHHLCKGTPLARAFRASLWVVDSLFTITHHPLQPSYIPLHPLSLHLPPHVPTLLPLPLSPLPPLPASLFIPPPTDHKEDIPKAELPPHKRLCLTTLTSRYEVEESSTAAPRPTRGHGIDYGFIGTLDAKTRC